MSASPVPPTIANRLAPVTQLGLFTLPILASNLYSIFAVIYWHWSVADLFFWFWCEFVLAGLITFVLLLQSPPADRRVSKRFTAWTFGFAFFYILIFATLFAAMAYKGEWQTWNRFPQFLAQKRGDLGFLVLLFAVLSAMTLAKRDPGTRAAEKVTLLFNRRCAVVVAFYLLFLVHGWLHEWSTGARSLSLSVSYLRAMGVTLILLKTLAEAGLFDRLCKRGANCS